MTRPPAFLRQSMEARGIDFRLGARTQALVGARSGWKRSCWRTVRELTADLVVMAAGIRPRTDLARDCGLHCDRGILVDDTLQTFDPSIYAVGECVQHRDLTYGLVAPLWEQARVCAAHLAERGVTRYRGSQAVDAAEGQRQSRCFPPAIFDGLDGAESIRYSDRAARYLQAALDRGQPGAGGRAVWRYAQRGLVCGADRAPARCVANCVDTLLLGDAPRAGAMP